MRGPEKLISAHLARRGGQANAEGVRGQARFLELAMDARILDAVEQLIGPDIILWGCHVFYKPAGDGHETPWHQDGHYWPLLADAAAGQLPVQARSGLPVSFATRPLWLLRGRDRTGRNDFDAGFENLG